MPVLCIGPFLMAMLGVLIVAGLVATPANCACGARMPHTHSLFMLAGHHHTSDGYHTKLPDASHGRMPGTSAGASPDDSPKIQEMAGHASDQLAMLVGEAQPGRDSWQRWTSRVDRIQLPDGQVLQPETGPPQLPV